MICGGKDDNGETLDDCYKLERTKATFATKVEIIRFPSSITLHKNGAHTAILDAVSSSGILKAKQKLGVTFNFDK